MHWGHGVANEGILYGRHCLDVRGDDNGMLP